MLSLHTNAATLSAQNSLGRTQASLSTSMTRLSTGFRINSAMDDAAGLQIATRLKAQTSGMAVAMRNTQNSISMLQTAEGALNEVTNILTRMKDLATQAADGSSSATDQGAMQKEFNSLTTELGNIISNTSFGGSKLLNNGTDGKFTAEVNFQIGSESSEQMKFDIKDSLGKMHTAISTAAGDFSGSTLEEGEEFEAGENAGKEISDVPEDDDTAPSAATGATNANGTIANLKAAIEAVSTVRSEMGAAANRLDHVYNNLSNVSTNTKNATGRIMDVDFATESANMTSKQMLMQAGTAMLKQTNSMSSMVMSLLQ
ncbi:flagellin N-terminal helical domain-containing protein [Massilia consociata]|uniref:Flagellin n=1 Tax=Massilia consociata TaxID=760117 RepID=A0ABV6FAP2_9BURK